MRAWLVILCAAVFIGVAAVSEQCVSNGEEGTGYDAVAPCSGCDENGECVSCTDEDRYQPVNGYCVEIHETLTPHEQPCVWSVEIERKSLLSYLKYKVYFNDWYFRFTTMNYNGVILSDVIYRPDLSFVGDPTEFDPEPEWLDDDAHVQPGPCDWCVRSQNERSEVKLFREFFYDGKTCYDRRVGFDSYNEDHFQFLKDDPYVFGDPENEIIILDGKRSDGDSLFRFGGKKFLEIFTSKTDWKHKQEGTLHKKKYTVYYDGEEDKGKDDYAVYVDKDNFIKAFVYHNNIPNERTELTFEYSKKADLADFAFDEDYIFNCSHNEIMKPPKGSKERCAASAVSSVAALVVISVICALLALF